MERGRKRLGTHPVGAGFLCDPCFRGEGTAPERASHYGTLTDQQARRSYRRRNLEKFREYQRRYRARRQTDSLKEER
jgi:hypothetical protein